MLVTIFGGSGFIGRHLVQRMAKAGARVRVVVRDPERGAFLEPLGGPGQIVLSRGTLLDEASVAESVEGAQVVVNLVGVLYETGSQTFDEIHAEGARRVAEAAKASGVERLLQMSAIGASMDSPALYGRTKAAGEAAVRKAFPRIMSALRPILLRNS